MSIQCNLHLHIILEIFISRWSKLNKNFSEKISATKQQKVLCILETIVGRAPWIYCIPKIVLDFVKIYFTDTNPALNEIG